MKRIFLDIETLPPAEEARAGMAQDVRLAQIAKKKPAIDHEVDELVNDQFRQLALHAERGRILTIGVLIEENDRVIHHGLLGRDRVTGKFHMDEAQTLKSFWHVVDDFNPHRDLFIGHNILDFDLPFIIKRSIIHSVKPSIAVPFCRYQRQPIFDTMWEWSCWRHRISLDDLAVALQIESSKQKDIDGSKIYDAFLAGRHSDIALYCMRDVECTRQVYYRLDFHEAPPLISYAVRTASVVVARPSPLATTVEYASVMR